MKVIVDISKEVYKDINKDTVFYNDYEEELRDAIRNGTPLEQITAEIRRIVDEETEQDKTWARGLHYALCIIEQCTGTDDFIYPIRQIGEWIDVTNGRGGHECSGCSTYAPSYQNGEEWLTNFCPQCGARMIK